MNEHSVHGLLDRSCQKAYCFSPEPNYLQNFRTILKHTYNDIYHDSEEIYSLVKLFAQIVDAKSPYTAAHSVGVANLSKYIAEQLGLDAVTCAKLEIAGLLHDLGKMLVPEKVLKKTTELNHRDLSYMRHHSYISFIILEKIDGMKDLARWAANHHETLDGSGYPFHRTAKDLCTGSRIVMVADIFQALAQNRPYRKAMLIEDIVSYLQKMSRNGKLDKEIVHLIDIESEACYNKAVCTKDG